MWAYSDYGELDLGLIPGKNHAPPSPSPWEPPRWAEPTASPAVLSRATLLCSSGRSDGPTGSLDGRPTGTAGSLRGIGGRQGVRELQQMGLRSKPAGWFCPGIWC